jgi:hypothetical protein
MYFHVWKATAPGSTPTDWTHLDLTYGNRNFLVLRFLAADNTKEFQAPRHTCILQAQLNQNLNKQLNMSMNLGGYNIFKNCPTSYSGVLLKKPIVSQQVKKFPKRHRKFFPSL